MKKLLSILLVLLLCLGIMTACGGDNGNNDAALDGAVDAVEALFTSTNTAEDYDLAGSVTVDGVTYTVTWAISNTEGVSLDGNKVTVADKPATEIAYTLTATVADAEGNTKTATINLKVPAYVAQYNTWAEYVAAENGAALKVSGVVTAIIKDAFAIVNDGKAFVVAGTVAEDIKVGVTVDVEGTKAVAAGNYRITATSVKVTNATAATVTPVDYTTIFTDAEGVNAEALVANQGLLVVIKHATIGGFNSTQKNYMFSIGENETYLKVNAASGLSNADQKVITDLHKANEGNYADITGIIQVANGNMYLVPVNTAAIANVEARVYTDAEKVALIKDAIKLDSVYALGATVTVPTAGEKGGTVAWASNNDAITYAEGKLTITIPNVYTEVTVTATITSGEVTEAVEYKVVLSSLENTIDVLKAAYALAAGKALPTTNKTLEGMVTVIDAAYAEATGVTLKLVVKSNNDYPLTVTLKDEKAANIVLGDTIMVTGQVKKTAEGVVVLDGATLDKISSGGNKLTFDLALPGEDVLHLNLKGSTSNKVVVVDEDGDKVLQIQKVNEFGEGATSADKKQVAVDYYYPALSAGDDTYVLEAAIRIDPNEHDTAKHIEVCFMFKNESGALVKIYAVMFTWNALTAGSPVTIQGQGGDTLGQAKDIDATVNGLALGTEFTIRMEYKYTDATTAGTVTTYINDARVIADHAVQNAAVGKAAACAEIQAYTAFCGNVTIDDYNVYTFASTYTFDDTYEDDQVFLDTKQWKKENENKFEIVTDNGNKYVKLTKTNGKNECQSAVDVFDPDNKDPERINYAEFSGRINLNRDTPAKNGDGFEILIRSIKDTAENPSPKDPDVKVAEAIFTFKTDDTITVRLNARQGGTASATKDLGVNKGEWFTFKLVYEVIDDKTASTTLYINGEKFLEGPTTACYHADGSAKLDSKFGELQCYTATTGVFLFDDLALDLKSAPIDWTAAVPGAPTSDATSDIGTLGTANNADFTVDKTTTAGWVAKNAQYIVDNATAGKPVIVLNGKKGAEGTFTSPVLNNGVAEVTFGYMALDTKEIALQVDILKDGSAVKSTTVYVKVNKGAAYTFTWTLDPAIGGDFQIKISNMALSKAEEDADLIAIWDVAYTAGKLPENIDFDLSGTSVPNSIYASKGTTTVKDGVLTHVAGDGSLIAFKIPNYSEGNTYSDVYQYVFESKFTFVGGKTAASNNLAGGSGAPGFIGFMNVDTLSNEGMDQYSYMYFADQTQVEADQAYLNFFGYNFEKGVTYDLKIVYVVGSKTYDIYIAGEKVSSFKAADQSKVSTDATLFGFGFNFRWTRHKDLTVSFADVSLAIEAAPNNGRNGISKYAENSVNFNDLDDTTIKTAPITGATVTGGAFEAVDKDGQWISVIGAVGSNKYVNMGHSNKKSGVTLTFGTKGAVVEKDKDFKKDTYVYELDFMYKDAFNPDNWQMKFQFSAKDINVTVNYKAPVEAKDAVLGDDGVTVVTPAVEAKPGKFLLGGKEWDLNKWYTLRFEITMREPEFHGVNDTTAVAHGYEIAIYVNNEYVTTTKRATPSFTETAATDTAAGKSVPNLAWESIDNTFRVNTRAKAQYVEIAVDNVYYGYHTAGYEPSLKDVDAPVAGTAYKFYLDQVKADKTIFFKGEMNGFYYASTEDVLAATELYLEAAETEGEYYVYFMNGDVKTYLTLEEALNSKTGKMVCNVVFKTDKAAASKWVYNTTIKSITSTLSVDGAMKTYYLGTYNNYTTFSASELKYVVDAETGALTDAYGTSSFVAHFAIYE